MRWRFLTMFQLLMLSACAPQITVPVSPPANVDPINQISTTPDVAIYVDAKGLTETTKVRGDACGRDSFELQMVEAFERPVNNALRRSLPETTIVNDDMTLNELKKSPYDTLLRVKGTNIGSGFDLEKDLFTTDIETTIAAGGLVSVLDENGNVVSESVYAPVTQAESAGIACQGAAVAVKEASKKAVRKLVDKSLNIIKADNEIRGQIQQP